jgi:pyrroloquinoline quinone biosynthesis protein E
MELFVIVKQYNNKLYIFEKKTGMTGIFSGNELEYLVNYAKNNLGQKNEFINRLYNLGILSKNSDLTEITKALVIKSPSLESLHIDILTNCPLKCKQCYKNDSENRLMTLEMFENFIKEAQKLKIFQIAIGGGEPLIHPNIIDFVKTVSKTQMAITITTSGYNLIDKLLDELINSGLNHIQISLNSPKKEINNLSRDGYEHAFSAIKKLSKKNISFGINMVIRKDNLKCFDGMVEFAKKYKADNINILRYKYSEHEDYEKNSLNSDEFIFLAESIKKVKNFNVKVDSAYSNLLIYLNMGLVSKERVGCGAKRSFIAITSDGSFKPCSHLNIEERAGSIKEYINDSKEIGTVEKCYSCKYYNLCYGCKAIGFDECPVYQDSMIS